MRCRAIGVGSAGEQACYIEEQEVRCALPKSRGLDCPALRACAGTKFFVAASKSMTRPQLEFALDTVYKLYADYVLKNPFYELEQPIQCEKFDVMLDKYFKTTSYPTSPGTGGNMA
jgi:hypothetical protein